METYESLFKSLRGNSQKRRDAVRALIADHHNKKKILKRLAEMIEQQSKIVYRPTPNGLKPDDRKAFTEINRATVLEQAAIQAVLGILGPDGLLDDERFVKLVDKSGMLERLGQWKDHVIVMKQEARNVAERFKERYKGRTIEKIKIFGLGGSAAPHDIAADIINNYGKSSTEIEVIHADRPNPDYITENTVVMLCSFSGNTEETINCYKTVKHKEPLIIALSKGGKLRDIANENDIPFIQLPEETKDPAYVQEPRESVCLQMTATLTFLACLGLDSGSNGNFKMEDLAFEEEILPLINEWREKIGPKIAFKDNPAKQLAFFLLYGIDYNGKVKLEKYDLWDKKVPFILVDRNNRSIGHEVRTQFHERPKLNAAFYEAPEFMHNLVESIRASQASSRLGLDKDTFVYYFIRSLDEEERIRLRLDKTIGLVLEGKGRYAILNAEGNNPYQRALFSTYFNAHMTTYLAILNGFDPLPVPSMVWIKNVMNGFERGGLEERDAQTIQKPLLIMN